MPGYYQGERGNRYGNMQGYRGGPGGGFNRGGPAGFRRHGPPTYDSYGFYGGPQVSMQQIPPPDLGYNRPSVKSRLMDTRPAPNYDNRQVNHNNQPRKRPRELYNYYGAKQSGWQPLIPSPNFDGNIKKRLKFSKKKSQDSEETKEKEKESEEDSTKKEEDNEEKTDDASGEEKENKTEDTEENKETKDEETEEKEDSDTPDKDKEPKIDLRALHCHICVIDEFKSEEEYTEHLETVGHYDMTHAFHARNSAALQLLRSNAQFAAMKQVAEIRATVTGKIKTRECFKCHCHVMGDISEHAKTTEHKMVINFLKNKCCGTVYNNPVDLAEHKLTIKHLKSDFENKQTLVSNDENDTKEGINYEDVDLENPEDTNAENGQDTLSSESIGPYDPNVEFQPDYIIKKANFLCRACWQTFYFCENAKSMHLRSHGHYDKVVSKIKAEEEKKRKAEEAAKKKEEAEKAEAEAKEKEDAENDETAGSDVSLGDIETVEDVIGNDNDAADTMDAEEEASMDVEETTKEEDVEEKPAAKAKRGRGRGRGRGKK